ncbi:MAG: TonB-dependent receptor [Prevotella sp.]|nr:TonB-dependent receptor [Prevotella sp.]
MKKQALKALALSMAFAMTVPATAQNNKTITGKVLDENGEPVIGATVRIAGSKGGTVTDFDGNYIIQAPANSELTVSYIGYKDMTTKGGYVKFAQSNSTDLNEVVVVGYGSQKKSHLTGSVATVPTDQIQDLVSTGLASSLSGLVNGLSVSGGDARPGESARMYIRDTNSLGDVGVTAQQPLFVIDGYIYPNDIKVGNSTQNLGAEAFNNLDPSEVESISVLKDASAAVYGARAANGVILVTTKKGKMGAPRISYSGSLGLTDEVARPKMLSAYDYGRLSNAVVAADPTNTSPNHTTALFQADELEAMKDLNYDLLDKYWKTAAVQRHSVNVSGATEKVNYFAGLGYVDQNGNLGKLDYNRWNFRAGVDVKISKWLGANINVSGDYGKKNQPLLKIGGTNAEKDYGLLLTHPRYIPESIGDYPLLTYGLSNQQKNQNQLYSFDVLQNNGDYKRNMTSNLNVQGSLSYDFGWSKLLKGLTLNFTYSKSINTDKGNEYGSSYQLYSMNQRFGSGNHLYTPTAGENYDDYVTSDNFTSLTISNGNYLSRSSTRTDNYQMNFTAQYARNFGQHHLQALFSIERSEAESEYQTTQREQPYEFTTGQYNSATGTISGVFTRSESGSLSYIGRLDYSYAEKYLLEFLLRSDASTKFSPQNYWGTFPAVSAGWVMSEEKWFQKAMPWWNFLKLRASFGLTGRDNTAAWQWMQVYAQDANKGVVLGEGSGNDSSNRITINKNNSAVNRDVHWDKDYKFNFGIDAHFLNSRLTATFDMYHEWNREMLMNIAQTVPFSVGTQSAAVNLGELDSWGYELSLNWSDRIGKNFKYHVGINTGYSDNAVLNMDWETEYAYRQITYKGRTDIGTWGMQCLGMFRSFQDIEEYFAKYNITSYMGLSKDQVRPGMLIYKDVRGAQHIDADGNVTYDGPDGIVDQDNDQVELSHRGNIYGFTINGGADWKGLSLNFQFNANWGGYTTVPSQALQAYAAGSANLEYANMPSFWDPDNMFVYQDIVDGSGNVVMKANRDALMPNLAYSSINAVASSFWRISSAQVTLGRVTLAYALPKAWLTKLGIGVENARVNITGINLINFYNPYPDHFTNPMAGSYGSYPNLRKWTIGVNLTF